MKGRLFAVFITMSLFLGCVKVEDLSMTKSLSSGGEEITFNTRTPATKAIVENTGMIDHFGVYGYVVPGNYSNGGYLMKNAEYDENGNAVSGPYYWPKSDNPNGIDFIFTAYSQFETAPTWENDTLKLAIPTLTQALIDNPDDFDDILWAQTKYNYHQNSLSDHERVILNFNHALSWLQFRGEVINTNIKWVRVKQISFGEFRDSIPGVAAVDPIPAYNDTTDTWFNLKRGTNCDGSVTKTSVSGGDYIDDYVLPAALVAEIKSYYSVDGSAAGDYDVNLGASAWNSSYGKTLRIVKDIPSTYKITYAIGGSNDTMDFFDAYKYLADNGYNVRMKTDGGKPGLFDGSYVPIDFRQNDNGTYSVIGFGPGLVSTVHVYDGGWADKSIVEYTIVEHPAVPGVPGVDPVPAHGSVGLYVGGTLCLPTKGTLTTTPLALYGIQKDTTLNYVKAQVDTIFTNDHIILGNSLVVPQPVPEKITVVFDICIVNPNGDEVVFTDRKITRTINSGKDADQDADYVASWAASNKYIYNFKFDGEIIDFSVLVSGWTLNGTEYHVWDY